MSNLCEKKGKNREKVEIIVICSYNATVNGYLPHKCSKNSCCDFYYVEYNRYVSELKR